MPRGMGAKQNHSFDWDASGFEGSDVAADEGGNLAWLLSHHLEFRALDLLVKHFQVAETS